MIRLWRRSFVVVTRMVHYKVFGSRVGDMQRGGPTGENERSLELWMWICAVGLLPPEGAVVWVCEMRGGEKTWESLPTTTAQKNGDRSIDGKW